MIRLLAGVGALACGGATGYGLMYLALKHGWIPVIKDFFARFI